jgi:hypothetical protein
VEKEVLVNPMPVVYEVSALNIFTMWGLVRGAFTPLQMLKNMK